MQMTIRMILQNAFSHLDAPLTNQLRTIEKKCPNIFKAMYHKNSGDASDDTSDVSSGADQDHQTSTTIAKLPAHTIKSLSLHNDMTQSFKNALLAAYVRDYREPEIYWFGHSRLFWSKKFAFTDRYVLVARSTASPHANLVIK